jgi:molybdopterin-guanine dinucleotide biosynthesis protein A
VLGAVLTGGRSSRFGSDKAAAQWRGATLADHAAATIARHVDATVRVGPDGLADLPRTGLGPLGGIAAALDAAAGQGFTSVLTIACDMPRLPGGLIEALLRRMPAYCIEAPVLGHWPAALGAQLLGHVERVQDRSVMRWARAIGALPIVAGEPIANVNTRGDLLAL